MSKCGKVMFASRRDAVVALGHLLGRRRDARKHGDMQVYFCDRCRAHHFGHRRHAMEDAERRKRRAVFAGGKES